MGKRRAGAAAADAEFRTTYVNRRAAEILRCEPEDHMGHIVSEFISAGD